MTIGICFVEFRPKKATFFMLRVKFGSDCVVLFSPVWNPQCLRACRQMRTRKIYIYIYIHKYIHIYMCICHTWHANAHSECSSCQWRGGVFSHDDHWVFVDRAVNRRRRRGSRSLRRARSPNSWRHDNTLQYHCALCAPAAIMARSRFWDTSSNVV